MWRGTPKVYIISKIARVTVGTDLSEMAVTLVVSGQRSDGHYSDGHYGNNFTATFHYSDDINTATLQYRESH